jgi:protein-tyrosine phosphatase
MDYENYKVLKSIARDRYDHIRLLGSFLGGGGEPEKVPPVPDPYYGGVEGFEEVLDMLESACPSLLDYCLDAINSGKQ